MNAANNNDSFGEGLFITTSNPISIVFLYRYGLGLVFLLGFTGNLASIVTFIRPTLRATSTGSLFLMMAVSDTVFLLMSIFDFVEVGITQGPIFLLSYDNLCRFRWYTKGLTQFCSAWILVLIAIDRWLRARFPFETNKWCTRRNALIGMVIVVVIGTGLYSHMLIARLFGRRFPGIATEACGPPLDGSDSPFYFSQWPYIQVVFVCLIPVLLMLASGSNIHYIIRKNKIRLQPIGANHPKRPRQERLQRQMLLLMISSIIIFFATTLPVNLRIIVATYQITTGNVTNLSEIAYQTAILTIFLSFNYAINFYVHCLASNLFRHEFIQCIKIVYRPCQVTIHGGAIAPMPSATNNIALVQLR